MKKSDFDKLEEWVNVGGGLMPTNEVAKDFLDQTVKGEVSQKKTVTARDIKFHRCYFALLNFIHEYLPVNFKKKVPDSDFYAWLKHLKKEYEVKYSFVDEDKIKDIIDYCVDLGINAEISSLIAKKFGKTDFLEYDSISFGRMDQHKFKNYIREQLPFIYENVVGKFYEGDMYNGIVDTIEEEFEKFLSKL